MHVPASRIMRKDCVCATLAYDGWQTNLTRPRAQISGNSAKPTGSQTQAAELVYSTLRSWQNWEADEVGRHPAIWARFRYRMQSGAAAPPPPMPRKYVRRVISFWWDKGAWSSGPTRKVLISGSARWDPA